MLVLYNGIANHFGEAEASFDNFEDWEDAIFDPKWKIC